MSVYFLILIGITLSSTYARNLPRNHDNPFYSLIQHLTPNQKLQVEKVLDDVTLSKENLQYELAALFESFGMSEEFEETINETDQVFNTLMSFQHLIESKLSPGARKLAQELFSMIDNGSISLAEQEQRTQNLWKNARREDAEELKAVLELLFSQNS
uniref:Uncharacterized protein n=1 Tax=Panagrolaimus sp. JU765 TaxID=591449 RepID=A0AC34QB66_9BILA